MRTVKQLKKNLEEIKAKNKLELDKLNAEYYERLNRGVDLTVVKQKIAQAETIAERSEALAERALAQAELRELKQEQATESARQRVAAETDARHKKIAQREFLSKGGSLQEFETSWPAIRARMLEETTVEKTANEEVRPLVLHSNL